MDIPIITTLYQPEKDNFSKDTSRWHYCRETFADKFEHTIYYSEPAIGELNNIINFIKYCEEKLNLQEKSQTKLVIFKIKNKNIEITGLEINLSPFWQICVCRKSLFTLLVRIGRNYTGSFDEIVPFSKYLVNRSVELSVKRFLNGNTKILGTKCHGNFGWVRKFTNMSNRKIKKLLVNPKQKNLFTWFTSMVKNLLK